MDIIPRNLIEIDKDLSVSGTFDLHEIDFIIKSKFKTIITTIPPRLWIPNFNRIKQILHDEGINYIYVPLPDRGKSYTDFYKRFLRAVNGKTLTHCRTGGASLRLAAAYLVAKGVPIRQGIDIISKKSPRKKFWDPSEMTGLKNLRRAYLAKVRQTTKKTSSRKSTGKPRHPRR